MRTVQTDIQKTISCLEQLGFTITPYGTGVAVLSIESGYSPAETASQLALATLAIDAREALSSAEDMARIFAHAMATLEVLKLLKDKGQISQELWKNDSTAMYKVTYPSQEQEEWIAAVLKDPVVSKKKVANALS